MGRNYSTYNTGSLYDSSVNNRIIVYFFKKQCQIRNTSSGNMHSSHNLNPNFVLANNNMKSKIF